MKPVIAICMLISILSCSPYKNQGISKYMYRIRVADLENAFKSTTFEEFHKTAFDLGYYYETKYPSGLWTFYRCSSSFEGYKTRQVKAFLEFAMTADRKSKRLYYYLPVEGDPMFIKNFAKDAAGRNFIMTKVEDNYLLCLSPDAIVTIVCEVVNENGRQVFRLKYESRDFY